MVKDAVPLGEFVEKGERFRVLLNDVFVDPAQDWLGYFVAAFSFPQWLAARWRKQAGAWQEFICAENNSDRFSHNLFPMPEAKSPDF